MKHSICPECELNAFHFVGFVEDETLFLELALRGYDLSSLRENTETDETTAEIVKIG